MVFLPLVPILLIVVLELLFVAGAPPPAVRAGPMPSEVSADVRPVPPSLPTAISPGFTGKLTERVLVSAETLVGVPYRYGGQRPGTGFDCSGFVGYVYGLHGVRLPRTSAAQAGVGRPVPMDPAAFRPGDLLFFATSGSAVDHVALYAGDGRLLHASETGGDVREDEIEGPGGGWLLERLVSVRRVVE